MKQASIATCLLFLLLIVVVVTNHVYSQTTTPKSQMMFSRDVYDGPACLEYSWVPEGKRRTVKLLPGRKEGTGLEPTSKEASHVQVYTLSNNGQVGLERWQFPPGGPHSSRVVGATVGLKGTEVTGTVYYEDGTTASDKHTLKGPAPKCPELP